jgi:putative transcriptional regulator
VAYAAGTAPQALAVLVACHLTWCPRCRNEVAVLDTLGAQLAPPADELEVPSIEALWARLDEPEVPPMPTIPPAGPDEVLPAPLRAAVGGGVASLPWRTLPLGVAHAELPLEGAHAFLADFPPGLQIPEHHHVGVERAMPLVGGFTTGGESFGPGDLSLGTEDQHAHQVRIDDDGRCLCLFVNDGDLVPNNPALRVVGWLLGLY